METGDFSPYSFSVNIHYNNSLFLLGLLFIETNMKVNDRIYRHVLEYEPKYVACFPPYHIIHQRAASKSTSVFVKHIRKVHFILFPE